MGAVHRRLLCAAVTTLGLAAVPATSHAHYDSSCYARANGTPYLVNGGTIGGSGYGACEDSTGHWNHESITAEAFIQRWNGWGWEWTRNGSVKSHAQNASHVGDFGTSLIWCNDGFNRTNTFRVAIEFIARNQAGSIVHTKWGYSARKDLSC